MEHGTRSVLVDLGRNGLSDWADQLSKFIRSNQKGGDWLFDESKKSWPLGSNQSKRFEGQICGFPVQVIFTDNPNGLTQSGRINPAWSILVSPVFTGSHSGKKDSSCDYGVFIGAVDPTGAEAEAVWLAIVEIFRELDRGCSAWRLD